MTIKTTYKILASSGDGQVTRIEQSATEALRAIASLLRDGCIVEALEDGKGQPLLVGNLRQSADRIPALYTERLRAKSLVDTGQYATEDEADALMDCWEACDAAAIVTPATSTAGAIVSIEWVRDELLRFGSDNRSPDNGTALVLALLNGVLGVLSGNQSAA